MFPTRMPFRLTVITLCLLPLNLAAQTMSGDATRVAEATIFEEFVDDNAGGYNQVCIGNLSTSGETRRGLVRFDLPDIPAGATVTRVVLEVVQDAIRGPNIGLAALPATLQVRRVTSAWEEGTGTRVGGGRACGSGEASGGVTWNNQPTTSSMRASANLTNDENFTATMDTDQGNANDELINDVQRWVDGEDNFGWEFRVAEETTANNARLVRASLLTVEWEGGAQGFVINAGINDAWFNPLTNGQGFFIIVFPDIPLVFLAWFTFDTERPPEDVMAILGDPGHRWITAQGGFAGDTATLDVVITRGGVFDSAEPAPENEIDGTMVVTFEDCTTGTVAYDILSLGLMGEVPIQRIANDNVALCEELAAAD